MRLISLVPSLSATIFLFALFASPAAAQDRQSETIESGISILKENTSVPAKAIPQSLLRDAEAVAVIPDMLKVGFVVAGRRGRGFLVVRNADGTWGNPIFTVLTGGSVGWQAGLQSTDVVLVFKNKRSLQRVLDGGGKLTLGADAGLAAGPIGRQASAGTDDTLKGEIFSYSRSRGLFAGVAIDGSVLEIDRDANDLFYGRPGVRPSDILTGQAIQIPPSANQLRETLAVLAPRERIAPPEPQQTGPISPELIARRDVQIAWNQFSPRLDLRWKTFFALPAQIFQSGPAPAPQAVQAAIQRFDRIAMDPQYQAVAALPYFQNTRTALAKYLTELQTPAAPAGSTLPPPPAN